MRLMLAVRERIVAAAPARWRAALLAVLVDRPLSFLTIFCIGTAVLIGFLAARSGLRSSQGLLTIQTMILALGITRGIIAADRVEQRWFILFQRPESPTSHYGRVLAISTVAVGGLLAFSGIALIVATNIAVGVAAYAGALLWALVCMATITGVSSLVRRFDLEITLLLITVSFAQGYLFQAVGLDGVGARVLSYALLPIDGVFMTWDGMLGTGLFPPAARVLHLLAYPAVWLGIASWRLRGSLQL